VCIVQVSKCPYGFSPLSGLSGDIGLNQTRKELVVAVLMFMIVPFSLILWSLDPASTPVEIPPDVIDKLGRTLREDILARQWNFLHDCTVHCRSFEAMEVVIATLDAVVIDSISEYNPRFHAFLRAELIFDLARMDEVTSIVRTEYVWIHPIP